MNAWVLLLSLYNDSTGEGITGRTGQGNATTPNGPTIQPFDSAQGCPEQCRGATPNPSRSSELGANRGNQANRRVFRPDASTGSTWIVGSLDRWELILTRI